VAAELLITNLSAPGVQQGTNSHGGGRGLKERKEGRFLDEGKEKGRQSLSSVQLKKIY